MSRIPFTFLLSAGLLAAPLFAAAQAAKPSAIESLRALAREKGDAEVARVVGVVGFHGTHQPDRWFMLQLDPRSPDWLSEQVVQGGRVAGQRRFRRDPHQDLPHIPIKLSDLTVDSTRAFYLADQAARRMGMGFDAIHYHLRCRDLRNEPVWILNLVDQADKPVAVIYLSAANGEILRSVWHRPGGASPGEAPPDTIFPKPSPAARAETKGLIPRLRDRS